MTNDRIFAGVYPCGIVYADRKNEVGGDYKRLGFLAYSTLELTLAPDCPVELCDEIRTDAATIQRKRGQSFPLSSSGNQSVVLGHALAESERVFIGAAIAPPPPAQITDDYQAGAILESSWGYDQTNIDFYRITKRTGDWLWLIPLNAKIVDNDHHNMRGRSVPGEPKAIGEDELAYKYGRFNGNPFRRRLAFRDGKPLGCSIKHGWAHLWDGQPAHFTNYA